MNPDKYTRYYNAAQKYYSKPTDIEDDDSVWDKHHSKEKRRELVTQKTLMLRERIEDWAGKNGYDNIGNDVERKDEKGDIYYRRTDWDMVDDLYGLLVNDEHWWPHPNQFIKMNELWKKYK